MSISSPQALQYHRKQLERLEVNCPHHIEFVNHYVHRGNVEEEGEHLEPNSILGRYQVHGPQSLSTTSEA